jgi:FkbM family methyltransferase
MSLKSSLARFPLVRQFAIKGLRAMARDMHIKNQWTGDDLLLNSFAHKSYWYYGRERENETMERFRDLVKPGATVIEVGGHIGMISQYFARLVGEGGRVIVFEPGANNMRYIEANIAGRKNVSLEKKAISDFVGTAEFYQDNISGQNNSLLPDYKRADGVASSHGIKLERIPIQVEVTTLDEYLRVSALKPDFIKIDIEGAELKALEGAAETMKTIRAMMVEVTEQHDKVNGMLRDAGFVLTDAQGADIGASRASGNVFAIKP